MRSTNFNIMVRLSGNKDKKTSRTEAIKNKGKVKWRNISNSTLTNISKSLQNLFSKQIECRIQLI